MVTYKKGISYEKASLAGHLNLDNRLFYMIF